jgi:hypothetical protein
LDKVELPQPHLVYSLPQFGLVWLIPCVTLPDLDKVEFHRLGVIQGNRAPDRIASCTTTPNNGEVGDVDDVGIPVLLWPSTATMPKNISARLQLGYETLLWQNNSCEDAPAKHEFGTLTLPQMGHFHIIFFYSIFNVRKIQAKSMNDVVLVL